MLQSISKITLLSAARFIIPEKLSLDQRTLVVTSVPLLLLTLCLQLPPLSFCTRWRTIIRVRIARVQVVPLAVVDHGNARDGYKVASTAVAFVARADAACYALLCLWCFRAGFGDKSCVPCSLQRTAIQEHVKPNFTHIFFCRHLRTTTALLSAVSRASYIAHSTDGGCYRQVWGSPKEVLWPATAKGESVSGARGSPSSRVQWSYCLT